MQLLKQSTATAIPFGPFVDKADGVTLKTDATTITDIDHATTGIFLSKNGGTGAIRHANVTASVADAYGMMLVTLDTTDTNALGRLRVSFAKAATYLPVHADFEVVPANVFDSLVSGSDLLDTNAAQLIGTAPTEGAGGRVAAAFTKFFDKASPTGTVNSLPDAVAGANNGLVTTNGTVVNQTVGLTAGQSIACSDKTGFSLSATGADLILKSSTFIQAIVAAVNEFATYGLTALNTLLVTTGIKAKLAAADVTGNLPADVKAITAGVDLSDTMKASVNGQCDTAISDAALATATNLATVDAVVDGLATTLGAAGAGLTALATTAELAKVPKSDSTVTFNATALASMKAQAVAALVTDTYAEPSAVPAATASLKDKIGWVAARARNEHTQTATTAKVKNDAGSGDIGTATVSDDSTTLTLGKFA